MKRAGAGFDDSKIPNLVLIYSAVASLGGSSLADEVARISESIQRFGSACSPASSRASCSRC